MGRDAEALASLGRAVELNPGRMRTLPPGPGNFESLRENPHFLRRLVGSADPTGRARLDEMPK